MFQTDRKRAEGHGTAREGTHHFWKMTLSSVALLVLVPAFIFTFGSVLGASYSEVVAYYARPFPALIAGLTLVVGLGHFRSGACVMVEDYARGAARKILIMGVNFLSYGAMAVGVFALARLAL